MAATPSTTVTNTETRFCVNHPQTETLLRCNKCGKPVCIKCVERTPVGYRCRECLGIQRQGYYNATTVDYVIAAVVGTMGAVIGGAIMGVLNLGFFGIILGIFAGPIGGGAVSESMRAVVQRRRGRYLWLVACAAIVCGGLLGLFGPTILALPVGGLSLLVRLAPRALLNIGFWIYLALAVSTAYARLRV